MTYNKFYNLRLSSLDCASVDQLIAEEGGSVDCDDVDKLIRDFTVIYNTKTIRDVRALTGLSQRAFGQEYNIPRRTLESWEAEERSCTEYQLNMLLFAVLSDIEYFQ